MLKVAGRLRSLDILVSLKRSRTGITISWLKRNRGRERGWGEWEKEWEHICNLSNDCQCEAVWRQCWELVVIVMRADPWNTGWNLTLLITDYQQNDRRHLNFRMPIPLRNSKLNQRNHRTSALDIESFSDSWYCHCLLAAYHPGNCVCLIDESAYDVLHAATLTSLLSHPVTVD